MAIRRFGRNGLLLITFMVMCFRVHSHGCGGRECPEITEQVNHCLVHSLMLPDGLYLNQRCGDSLDCIQQTFTYFQQNDALRVLSDNPFEDSQYYWINNVCYFYGKGFELNITPSYGWLFTTHSPAYFRFTGTVMEYGSILKGEGAVGEDRRSYIEQWIMRHENNFQESCQDIKYFHSIDLLTANCRESHMYRNPSSYHQTGIPNISFYAVSSKNIIVNDNGILKIRPGSKFSHEEQELRHQRLEQECVDKGMTVRHVGEYELCHAEELPLTVHNCPIAESAFDRVKDTLFIRCYGLKQGVLPARRE